MKIIDAYWEKRNMGVSTTEILINKDDNLSDICNELNKINSDYVVVKCPSLKTDLHFELTKLGFTFIETIFHFTSNLKNLSINNIQKRISDKIIYEEMNQSDLIELSKEIDEGLFYTDRVALDPMFNKFQATNRYNLWIKDEIERGCQVYKMIYKEKTIGFFTFKDMGDGVFSPFLAGLYKEYQNSSFGGVYVIKEIEEAIKRNGKKILAYVSSNNLNAFKLIANMGFLLEDANYIFVKHNNI